MREQIGSTISCSLMRNYLASINLSNRRSATTTGFTHLFLILRFNRKRLVWLTRKFIKTHINIMKNTNLLSSSIAGCGAVAIVLGLLTSPLQADEKDAAAVKVNAGEKPDMAEMMKKMEELAAPAPEHKTLASLAGEWETEAKCYMTGADGAPTVSKGTCKSKMILGGRFLQEEFDGDMMGKKFHGMGITGYDKFNKKFFNTWVDDMGTGVLVTEGTCDASGKVLTLTGKMDDPMTGEKEKEVKLVTRIVSPDKHTFEMHDMALGEKSKMMEITYTRKPGTSGSLTSTR
jgi:hypothetical protein